MADLRARVVATGLATLAISARGQGQRGRRRRNHEPDSIHQPICAIAVSAQPLTVALAKGSQPESRLPRPAHQGSVATTPGMAAGAPGMAWAVIHLKRGRSRRILTVVVLMPIIQHGGERHWSCASFRAGPCRKPPGLACSC